MIVYDVLALLLNGFSHVYMYRLLIGYQKMSIATTAGLSVVFSLLLGVIISVTGYPEWNGILLLVFLVAIGYLKSGVPILRNLFYALFSISGLTLTRLVGMEAAMALFMASPLNLYIWTPSLLHLLVSFIILLLVISGKRQLALFGQYVMRGTVYIVSYIVLLAGFTVVMLLSSPALLTSVHWYEKAASVSYVAAFVLFFFLLAVLLISWQIIKDRMADQQQQLLDAELLNYIEKLEQINDEFISFRHDYLNVLQMLDVGVRTKNLQLIEEVYQNEVEPTSEQLKFREYDLLKLSKIGIPAVKSVLGVKVMEAYGQDIDVIIDIPEKIGSIAMPVIDFVRMISALLDNAIEEASVTKEKRILIACFEITDVQYVVVENSCRTETIDIPLLYGKKYSSKGGERGIGLYSVKRILDRSANVMLETSSADCLFRQKIVLKKSSDRL